MRFAEPPSVDGTAGPQMDPVEPVPADDAVVCAALEDELGASPGSCSATFGSDSPGALIDPDEFDGAAAPLADPVDIELVEPPVVVLPVAIEPAAPVDVEKNGALLEVDVVPPGPTVVVATPGVVLPAVPVVACRLPGVCA